MKKPFRVKRVPAWTLIVDANEEPVCTVSTKDLAGDWLNAAEVDRRAEVLAIILNRAASKL